MPQSPTPRAPKAAPFLSPEVRQAIADTRAQLKVARELAQAQRSQLEAIRAQPKLRKFDPQLFQGVQLALSAGRKMR